MLEKDQFKIRSLRFARSLQTVIKMVNLFSAGHTNSVRPLQLSYDLLNALVKETRYLTIGFVDQRVLLNNILTTESTIQPLENEFLKRGIGAVTFDAGITLAAYKNVVSVLAANPKALEDVGGLLPLWSNGRWSLRAFFRRTRTKYATTTATPCWRWDRKSS
jgi:hypothetical protein